MNDDTMMMGEFEVTGKAEYRGHAHGEIFEARLNRAAVSRAVARGSIRMLRIVNPVIPPGKYSLPDGWLSNRERN